jgi:hypothetical protein
MIRPLRCSDIRSERFAKGKKKGADPTVSANGAPGPEKMTRKAFALHAIDAVGGAIRKHED